MAELKRTYEFYKFRARELGPQRACRAAQCFAFADTANEFRTGPLVRSAEPRLILAGTCGLSAVRRKSRSGFSMGAPQALFDTRLSREDRQIGNAAPIGWSYDVAPDGKRFLVRVIREPGAEAPPVLVTNWQALLK